MNCLSFLTNPSVLSEWTDGHPAFECANGAVVRGYLRMLRRAIRAEVPGVLSSSSIALAEVTGLREADVIEMWDVLTHGWFLTSDGNLQHDGVAKHCIAFIAEFNSEVCAVHDKIRVVEDLFQLAASDSVPKARKKGAGVPRSVPKGFHLGETHVQWLVSARGIVDAVHHRFLMDKFLAYARSKNLRFADWDAAFIENVDEVIRKFGLPPIPNPLHTEDEPSAARPVFGSRSRKSNPESGRSESSGASIRASHRGIRRGGAMQPDQGSASQLESE